MRREDIDYITPQTAFSRSLLVALGYKVHFKRRGKTHMEDQFEIRLDGKHIPHWNEKKKQNVPYVQRKFFFDFARRRHGSLRLAPLERRIEGYID
jgi:hypothetical protein